MLDGSRDLALVTGASSGIGAAFARVLAAKGWDLAITARRGDRLERLREELCAEHRVEVNVIERDLAAPDGAESLLARCRDLGRPVTMLVNNAGLGCYGPMVESALEPIRLQLQVNLVCLTELARLFGADMARRGRGYLLNVSSMAGLMPLPRYAVYSATKAYVLSLSQTMRYELRRSGVQVSVLCPGVVDTEFFHAAGHPPGFWMRQMTLCAAHVARAGVAGVLRGKPVIVPGVVYKAGALLARVLSPGLASAFMDAIVGR